MRIGSLSEGKAKKMIGLDIEYRKSILRCVYITCVWLNRSGRRGRFDLGLVIKKRVDLNEIRVLDSGVDDSQVLVDLFCGWLAESVGELSVERLN